MPTATAPPPGPRGGFLTGNLADLRRDLLGLYTRTAREFGPVARLRFGLRTVWLVTGPDLIDEILHSRNFHKHYALRMNRRLLGEGILVSEGDHWLRQRRLIQPAFLRDRMAGYGASMAEATSRHVRRWQDGSRRDVHADMRELTMEIAATTLFGAEVKTQSAAVSTALKAVMDSFIDRLFSVMQLPEYVPTPANLKAGRAIRELDRILYEIISQRRGESERHDLLSILLHARDEQDGSRMSDKQLRDEAMTLFLAGHETTALALTYTLHQLAAHPEVQEQLADEARSVLGDRPPSADDVPKLPFAERVILESMRLYPPAYTIGRQNVEACELGGYRLPAGGTVLLPQWVLHRDEAYWDEPMKFDPSRWEGGLLKKLPRGVYFPFGGGARVCIGNTFAMMEMAIVLAEVVRRYRLEAASDAPLTFRPRMTLAPAGVVEVVCRARV